MKKGFTLIEMLVVIGIIATLVGISVGGYSAITKSAEKARCQELVSNTATALTALYQKEGVWPKILREKAAQGDSKLDQDAAYVLVAGSTKYLSLTVKNDKLAGYDRFGVVTPWALTTIKRLGTSASIGSKVVGSSGTIDDHLLRFAIDLDGDGIIEGANVGGQSVDIRATAAVWCCGKDGVISSYPYAGKKEKGGQKGAGKRSDDIYSWTPGQTRNVQ